MKASLLRQIPLFASLPDDEIEQLAQSLRLSEHAAGAILFRERDPGDRFSIILDGEIEIIKAFGTAEESILAVEGPGDYLGEVSLLYPDGLRSATARARSDARLLEMTPADFDGLIQRQPGLALILVRELSPHMRHSENLIIRDLQEKNLRLAQALRQLQAAQEQLLEKEKLEQELSIARRIQESSLPKALPALSGWELAVYWQPARAVGGDFYDFIQLSPDKLALVTGDVTGKGVPAALVMATTQTMLRFAAQLGPDGQAFSPGQVLASVNEMSCRATPASMYITCLIVEIDLEGGRIVYANAGHNLPYLCSREGVVELRAVGMPLGLMPGMDYEEKEAQLATGDSLFLYSDGLHEAHNRQKEMYGSPRLRSHLGKHPGGVGLVDHVLENLAEFTGPDWEQEDDVTCLVLERRHLQS